MKKTIAALVAGIALVAMMSCDKKCDYTIGSTEYCYDTAGNYSVGGLTVDLGILGVSYDADTLETACDAWSGTMGSGTCN